MKNRRTKYKILLVFLVLLLTTWCASAYIFNLTPNKVAINGAKVLFSYVCAVIYHSDTKLVNDITEKYCVGMRQLRLLDVDNSWKNIEKQIHGFRFLGKKNQIMINYGIPFVYEKPLSSTLTEFRKYYHLEKIIKNTNDEYDAMLKIAAWAGTRWDHGLDIVPGGTKICDPIEVVRAGQAGAKFWCEIAARLMVNAATALGWPARLVTASRDGYTWEHAVTELWSNKYNKWFVVDTDFNLVYESNNIPLSAFELCHNGSQLQSKGLLQTRYFASIKPSLKRIDLLPYYRYVHIDMRNDWCTRVLRRGSPAGGELSTWWTANAAVGRILTAKRRVNEHENFDWPVNSLDVHVLGAKQDKDGVRIEVGLVGYSPFFVEFETVFDSGPWIASRSGRFSFVVSPGYHSIKARIVTLAGHKGPISEVRFVLVNAASN